MRVTLLAFPLAVTALAVAACSGATHSGVLPQGGFAPASSHRAALSLRMTIPAGSTVTSPATKRRAYVSSSVASVVYAIALPGSSTSLVVGPDYTNIASTPAPCSTPAGGGAESCTFSIDAQIATSASYTVTIATYDAAQTAACTPGGVPACAGNLLGEASLPETITTGATTPLAVTLGGTPAFFQPVMLLPGDISGQGNNSQGLLLYGPAAETGEFELLDAQKNVIVDPGTPQVTAVSSAPSALGVTLTESAGLYTVVFTPKTTASAIGPVVQPGSYSVQLSIVNPQATAAPPLAYAVPVEVLHSAIYDGECFSGLCSGVHGYFDGNYTSPGFSLPISGAGNIQVATDLSGNLYVATNNAPIKEYAAPVPLQTPAVFAQSANIVAASAIAVDQNGQLYVATPDQTLTFASGNLAGTSGTSPIGAGFTNLAVDTNDTLYGVLGASQTVSEYAQPGTSVTGTLSFGALEGFDISSIALDLTTANGTPKAVWAGTSHTTNFEEQLIVSSGIATFTPGQFGNAGPSALAIDGTGTVYYATQTASGAPQVFALVPPSYTAPSTPLFAPPNPTVSLAVVPSANQLSPQTGGSPSPLATVPPTQVPSKTHR